MIHDLENAEAPSDYSCDVAIVGGGAVGITLAVALSRAGLDVILLEGGGVSLESSSQNMYRGVSTNPIFEGLQKGRFRLLGGTTNFWGGQLATFDSIIFEDRPWLPISAWPIQREILEPYYEKAFELLGLRRGLRDDEAVWRNLGTSPPDLGRELDIFLTRWAPDPNFARLFQRDLAAPNLRTVIHGNVIALEAAPSGGALERLHLRTVNGRTGSVRASRIVLACGTIEIARLLQLPLHDGQTPPWHSNPWLGRAFFDHVDCTAGEIKCSDEAAFHQIFDNIFLSGFKYNPKIKFSRAAQTKHRTLDVAGQFLFRSRYSDHLESLKMLIRALQQGRVPNGITALPRHVLTLSRFIFPLVYRYVKSNRIFSISDEGIFLRLMSEQWPSMESKISLSRERDILGMPSVRLDWKIDNRQIESLAKFSELVGTALRMHGLAELKIDPLLIERNPKFLHTADDGFHQMGGARMGANAAEGVVNPNMLVFGTPNLYVAGAATFPVTGFANPTFTAIALGLRLADHLIRKN